ncbi:MAG: adenine deaminase [Deltaproteobacteria bacterium]|nr:adenine deaminase [Deltaproteobacteria bacterium]
MELERTIAVACGEEPADLIIRNGQVVNVFSGDIHRADVAIAGGRVVGFGSYEGREEFDATGLYIAPGFIDAHIHLESTMLTPREFARAVVPNGTTTVVADPHEIANVLGLEGINYMLASSRDLPLTIFFMLPSCVPTTDLETAGASLGACELAMLLPHPQVLGLAEMMNFPGVLARDREVLAKLQVGRAKRIDGHAPGLAGKHLNAYVGAGIKSDHECTTAAEALEKLRAGMHVFIREGSIAKNMEALVPVVTPSNYVRCGLVSDDRHPTDLLAEGHVNWLLKKAVALGLPPVTAIQMVTINPAKYFFTSDFGAVAPSYRADLVLLETLTDFRPRAVFKDGHEVARDGRLLEALPPPVPISRSTINIGWPRVASLEIQVRGQIVKVIEVVPDQLITNTALLSPTVRDGLAIADPAQDISKLAVVERHRATGNVGVGFVRGLGLRSGAIASSVAHDSHNIVVAGTSDLDMLAAVKAVEHMQGGLVAVRDASVLAAVRLPIAGLMSDQALETVAAEMHELLEAARAIGSPLRNPFMVLSFLALPVIPSLRLTDHGLVDVARFRLVPLFGDS